MKLAAVFLLSTLSCSVLACSEAESKVLNNLSQQINRDLLISGSEKINFTTLNPVCKMWPSQQNASIIVKPYTYSISKKNIEEVYFAIAIAVINISTGEIESKLNDRRITTLDAISPERITIDTARYRASKHDSSFGIRIMQGNLSNIAPFQEEFINIYSRSGDKIKSLARGIKTSTYNGEGDGNCSFNGESSNSTISTGATITNHKNDLIISTIKTKIESKAINNKCITSTSARSTIRNKIKFNGTQYVIPKELKSSLAL